MTEATFPAAASPPRPTRLPGGPLPLTMRQGAVAAVVILIVGLGAALFTPIAAAVEARRVTPPGGVVAGEAVIVPAPGWTVQTQQTNAVLLTRAGAQMLVWWEAVTPPPPQQALAVLASATEQAVPETRALGGVRPFTTPSADPGYLQPFAAPGTTGAIAVVQSTRGQALVQAVAPSTTFSEVADDLMSMITGLRIRRGGGS